MMDSVRKRRVNASVLGKARQGKASNAKRPTLSGS